MVCLEITTPGPVVFLFLIALTGKITWHRPKMKHSFSDLRCLVHNFPCSKVDPPWGERFQDGAVAEIQRGHPPTLKYSSRAPLCTLRITKKKKKKFFLNFFCTPWQHDTLFTFVRIRGAEHLKRRRKIHICATNEMQEKAGRKAKEAHFTYITPHKCFTLTNAEVDQRHPIIIRLPAVGSPSGCCIFPSQMLTRPTSTARHIAKCQPPPHPRLLEQAADIIAAPLFSSRAFAD